MPIPLKYLVDFEENGMYHVYNRTNNNEKLFITDENRIFFLKRYKEILSPFVDTFSWTLLFNHFHFVIRAKPENEIIAYLLSKEKAQLTITEKKFLETRVAHLPKVGNLTSFSELIEATFKRFFQSYALAYNKQYKRKGNLFYKPFKRVKIKDDSHFTMAIIYTHANAFHHKLVKDFTEYPWSSWHTLLSDKPTELRRDEIIDWFGSIENCIKVHKKLARYYYDCEVAIEF